MTGLAILASGMVTSVGLSAPATCAAIRCGLDNNQETRFMDQSGEWISAAMVPLEQPWRGLAKLKHMVVSAIRECLSVLDADIPTTMIPLFLCVAEENRPGRLQGLDAQFLNTVQDELGVTFHPQSAIIAEGRIGPVQAIRQMMAQQQTGYCIVAGVDSFLIASTLQAYEERMRLLTEKNSNGFIPGEAGAAVLLGRRNSGLMIRGIGFGKEAAHIESEEPLRADGLVKVINEALADAKLDNGDIDLKIFDANGEQYIFKEAALAKIRIFREPKKEFDIWHPAECTGEVGAATVPIMLGVTLAASIKKYTPGNRILCHLGNDDGRRAAMIICSETTGVTNG